MLTSKQRAYLRSLSNKLEPIFQVGKGGVNDNQLKQIDDALEKRELVKVHVLENALLDTREVCNEVADALGAEPVQVIGKKFIIYKESRDNKRIDLKDADLSETARIRKRAAEANKKAAPKTSKPKRFEADKSGKKFGAKTLRTRRSK